MKETSRRGAFCALRRLVVLGFAMLAWQGVTPYVAAQNGLALRVSSIQSNGWVRISGALSNYSVISLEASSNLVHWKTIAVLHDYPTFEFADPVSPRMPHRFYRFSAARYDFTNLTNDWKNQIRAPYEHFMRDVVGRWVKFAILMDDPSRVYYADGSAYLFHYDFATARLGPFLGVDPETFDAVSLYNTGRQVILGAVLFPRSTSIQEFGIQFVTHDALSRELVKDLFQLVESTVVTDRAFRAFYMPTFEQMRLAEADRAWLEAHGVTIGSPERWATENTCYSTGWALGTLKFYVANEIEAAYADGRLLPQDILITEGLPAELPYLAGIITLAPATPNSHVVILAQSHQVPVAHLWDQTERERVLQLVGQEIAYHVSSSGGENICAVDVYALDRDLDPALRAEILAAKNGPPVNIRPMAHYGGYTAPTDNLTPVDIQFFGGKAANYGLLRRTIPSNAPPAIAISFDLWNEFMAQRLANGKTLRQEISNRLAGFTYPAHISAIKTNLASIRTLIRQSTQFATGQREAIIAALRVFDSRSNIRFRSSTNVEDTETFTGAGLYDSYSGCLDDDLDDDNDGPSHCDPTEEDERGVFRAMRRVYASFYNDNAYLERLRRGVDESSVGMAMLVHHSTPDAIEMANGVATVRDDGWAMAGRLVSQLGAISVANPEGNAVPELIESYYQHDYENVRLELIQPSSLVLLGDHVMNWETDYRALAGLLNTVSSAYREMTGKWGQSVLDFEYKKIQPGWLEVKQVREIPGMNSLGVPAPAFLLNQPVSFIPYQGSHEDGPFPGRRLKSRWTFQTKNLRFAETNFTFTPYGEVTIEHINGDRIETLSGPLNTFLNSSNATTYYEDAIESQDSWRMGSLGGPVDLELITHLPGRGLTTIKDANLWLTAKYNYPVPYHHHSWGLLTRSNDAIALLVAPRLTPEDFTVENAFFFAEGRTNVTIDTSYIYGPSMVHGLRTRIAGLTSEPIQLTNYFSQTIDLGHLGAGAQFLFEPRFEPGLSSNILNELEALNIRLVHLSQPGFQHRLAFMGREGTRRSFGARPGSTMRVNVTDSDGPPFFPAGSTYTMTFHDTGSYTLTPDDESDVIRGTYWYSRKGQVEGILIDPNVNSMRWQLTFTHIASGAIRREQPAAQDSWIGEDGTFTVE